MKIDKKWICLIIATILNVFSLGIMNFFLFAWIWPILMLVFIRKSSIKETTLFVLASLLFSALIKWIGLSHYNYLLDAFVAMIISIPAYASFVIYRLLQDKCKGWQSTLILPLTWVTLDLLVCLLPIANVSMMAYSQIRILPFIQFASVLGTHSLSFLIIWFASVIEYSIVYQKKQKKLPGISFLYCFLLVLTFLYGGVKINKLTNETVETVNIVSCIGISNEDYDNGDLVVRSIEEYYSNIDTTTQQAHELGAEIFNYTEEAFLIKDESKNDIINYVSAKAVLYDMYIILPLDIYNQSSPTECLNELVVINKQGDVIYEYQKQKLIPVVETYDYASDKQVLATFDTEYGKVTTVICYDLDFVNYINKVGKLHPDIVIAPSWDYPAIQYFHTFNTSFRAVENGFNLVRNTAYGVTAYFDTSGKALEYYNSNRDGYNYIISGQVPTKGTKTIYSYIGQFIDYIYPLGLACLMLYIFLPRHKKNSAA